MPARECPQASRPFLRRRRRGPRVSLPMWRTSSARHSQRGALSSNSRFPTRTRTWQAGGRSARQVRRAPALDDQERRLAARASALSRGQAGIGACESVDLAVLAAEVLRTTDLEGLTASVRLKHASTTGAPNLIERLLDNLLANAVRHNTAGGWIALTTRSSRSRALLTIENSGPHIRADDVARLFQPFEQLSKSGTGPTTGLGLGLAVVKTVADAHRAQISAHARPAGGLRVEVVPRR